MAPPDSKGAAEEAQHVFPTDPQCGGMPRSLPQRLPDKGQSQGCHSIEMCDSEGVMGAAAPSSYPPPQRSCKQVSPSLTSAGKATSSYIVSASAGAHTAEAINPLMPFTLGNQLETSSGGIVVAASNHPPLRSHAIDFGEGIQELRQQLAAIPTKSDMEGYIKRLESAYRSEIQAITTNISQISDQVQRIEGEVATVSSHQATQDNVIGQHTQQIHMLFAIAEDHENRNRRNNLRVRGIPESVPTAQILPTLKRLFNNLLEVADTSPLEIDRAHRTLGPKNQDPNRPRDILCRMHYFTVKEQILRKARDRGDITLDGCQVQLLSDLSKMTLDKRRALRPLLDMLREHGIPYSWGYPFQLQVRRDGSLLVVHTPADVPTFCMDLRLPSVNIRDWPYVPLPPIRPAQRRRGRSPPSPQDRPRGARAPPP